MIQNNSPNWKTTMIRFMLSLTTITLFALGTIRCVNGEYTIAAFDLTVAFLGLLGLSIRRPQ
jgi:hypothetical protein